MDNLQSQTPKEAAWRSRLQRHAQSGQSIAAFCRDEAASAASFPIWRAKLAAASGDRSRRWCQSDDDETLILPRRRQLHLLSPLYSGRECPTSHATARAFGRTWARPRARCCGHSHAGHSGW
ncbi:IS66 family insertion sequence element accessory protein TnpA [Massilia scottii]|uniref:IS66 family insertion sequence element accessory protein TnpA n=1 Tax=Massilia scottii TaxID=3057166 RepID=UPI004044FF70